MSIITSGMLSIVGERECAHAKLEAHMYIRHYGMDSAGYIYIYYVAMVTAGLYIAYTPHQYST